MTDEREVIQTGGPPEPVEDKPVSIAVHDLVEQVANLRLEIEALKQRIKTLEGE